MSEIIIQYDAVRLFIERALAVKPNFAITDENAPAVAQICARLDGLPLAIELAAARIKFLPPQMLLEKLERRLDVAVGGARDLPARQQTLRGAIDWSYNLLDADEQLLFRRLAVFVGGCTIAAAEAICNAEGDLRIDVASGIESLVDKSLIYQADSADGEPRFAMLETIREYALEKLEESGEAGAVRDRHLAFFLAFMDTIERESSPVSDWRARLEPEHDNLRAALAWSHTAPAEGVTDLQLASALAPFWMTHGYYEEGQQWLEQALGKHPEAPPQLRGNALRQAGRIADMRGDYPRARMHYEASLELFRAAGIRRGMAHVLRELGWIEYFVGNHAKAQLLGEESLAIHRESENKPGIASALLLLGRLAATANDYSMARAYYEESLAIRRQVGNQSAIGGALESLGDLARNQEDYATAQRLYEESLAIKTGSGYKQAIAGALGRLGIVAVWQGEFERAMRLFGDALALFREIGARRGVAWTLSNTGWAALAQADYTTARECYEQSRALFQALGEQGTATNQTRALGDVYLAQGDYALAEQHYQEGLSLWRALDNQLGVAMTIRCLGRLAFRQQAYDQAIRYYEESLALFRASNDRYETTRAQISLARALTRRGDYERARMLYEESLAIAREIERPSAVAATLEGLADLAQARGDMIAAARLLGVAERIREERGVPHWPADRLEYDALVDAVRAALGEEVFDKAWAEGRALTIEQAVAESLSR